MAQNTYLYKNSKIFSSDNLNKFLLLSIFQNFDVNKVQIKVFSNDFTTLSFDSDDNDIMSKINSLTWVYFLFGSFPSITCIKKKFTKRMDKNVNDQFFILDIKILNKNFINKFILKLMLEHEFFENNLESDNLNNISIHSKGIINYNTKISMSQIFEQQEFFDVNNINCNVSKINASINFTFNSISKYMKNHMLLRDALYYKLQYL